VQLPKTFFSRVDILIALALPLLPVILVILATANGIGVSPDSVTYAAAAESFAANGVLRDFTGDDLSLFPPGLPILVGALVSVGLPLATASLSLNIVSLVVTIVIGYSLARFALPSRLWATAVTAVFAWSRTTTEIFSMLWSEPVFTMITTTTALLVVRAYRIQRLTPPVTLVIGLLMAVALSLRYSAIFLILAVTLTSMLIGYPNGRNRVSRLSIVAGPSVLTLVATGYRNLHNGHGFLGDRFPSSITLQGSFQSSIDTVGSLLSWRGSIGIPVILGTVIIVLAVVGGWWSIVKKCPATPLTLIVSLYLAGLIASQSTTRLDAASERLVYPVYLPLLILAANGLWVSYKTVQTQIRGRWPSITPNSLRLVTSVPIALAAVTLISLGLLNSARFSLDGYRNGIGYNSVEIQNSTLAIFLRGIEPEIFVVTNNPWLVAWLRPGSQTLPMAPDSNERPSDRILRDEERINIALRDAQSGRLLIFEDGPSFQDPFHPGHGWIPVPMDISSDVTDKISLYQLGT
jgi:hypothetical protein